MLLIASAVALVAGLVIVAVRAGWVLYRKLRYPVWWNSNYKLVARAWPVNLDRPREREYIVVKGQLLARMKENGDPVKHVFGWQIPEYKWATPDDPYIGPAVKYWLKQNRKVS